MKRTLPTWCKEVKKSMIDDDLNVTELAERVGLSRNYVSGVVNGRVYAPEIAKIISKDRNITVPYTELKSYYCKNMCPLGKDFPDVKLEALDRISVKALSSFRKISAAKELLLDITEDGVITENEKDDLNEIIKTLDEVSRITQSLKIWAEKNLE